MANIQTNYFVTTLKLLHFLHTNTSSFRDKFKRELSSSRNITLDNKNKFFEGIPLKSYFAVLGSIDPSYKSLNYSHFTNDEIAEEFITFYENKNRRDLLEKSAVVEEHYLTTEEKLNTPETDPEADIERRAEIIEKKREEIPEEDLIRQQETYYPEQGQATQPQSDSSEDNNFWNRRNALKQSTTTDNQIERTLRTRPMPRSFLGSEQMTNVGRNIASKTQILGSKGLGSAIKAGGGLLRSSAGTLGRLLGAGRVAGALGTTAGAIGSIGAFLATPAGWITIAIIIIFLLVFIFSSGGTNTLFVPFDQNTTSSISSPPPGGGGVGACEYTQGTTNNLKFKSTTLLSWIEREAGANGIPTAILGSIAMHESPNFAPILTNESGEIRNNRLCNPGQPFCEKNGSNLHQGECNAGELSGGARTGRAMGLMQIVDIFNSDIDVCNIQQNIKRGAEILKGKLPSGASFEQEGGAKRAVCRYFGVDTTVCPYTSSNDYGAEAWNDYQRCLTAPPPGSTPNPSATPGPIGPLGFTVTCPVDPVGNNNFATTCGTYDFPSPNGCGHGKPPAYASCDPDIYAECGSVDGTGFRQHGAFLKKSIDIVVPGGSDGKPVYLPYLNGNQSVTWTKTGNIVAIAGGSWGYKQLYTTQFNGKTILLDLTHINSSLTNGGSNLPSGTQVATLFRSGGSFGGAHLHTGLKVDNVPVEPQRQGFMCTARQP